MRDAAVRAGLPVLQGSADFCTVPDAGRKDRRADFTHPDPCSEASTMRMCVKHESALNKVELASKVRPVKVAEYSSYPLRLFYMQKVWVRAPMEPWLQNKHFILKVPWMKTRM